MTFMCCRIAYLVSFWVPKIYLILAMISFHDQYYFAFEILYIKKRRSEDDGIDDGMMEIPSK